MDLEIIVFVAGVMSGVALGLITSAVLHMQMLAEGDE